MAKKPAKPRKSKPKLEIIEPLHTEPAWTEPNSPEHQDEFPPMTQPASALEPLPASTALQQQWVAVQDAPFAAPKVHGPFADQQTAYAYAETQKGLDWQWHVVPLQPVIGSV
jgi:hypothetical protein